MLNNDFIIYLINFFYFLAIFLVTDYRFFTWSPQLNQFPKLKYNYDLIDFPPKIEPQL